jgi:hypothetical protein
VVFVAVNAEQAEDRATPSGHALGADVSRIEVAEARRLAAGAGAQASELTRQVRDHLVPYTSPAGVTMPAAAWLVTAQAA